MDHSFTILIPVYNEEECILPLVKETNKFLEKVSIPTSILFINDGSNDKSLELIKTVCISDKNYHFISLNRNYGLSTALKAGIDNANSTLLGYLDADLQTSPMDFFKLLEHIDQYDLVTGYRQIRQDTVIKRATSSLANYLRRILLNDNIIDTGCPLKIIKTDIAKRLPFYEGLHRFIPNLVTILGGTVKQIPIPHFKRYAGTSKFNFRNRLFGPVIDAIALRWMQRNVISYQINEYSKNLNGKQPNGSNDKKSPSEFAIGHNPILGSREND
ncbi:dolichol-phosphate mannosyltransferase [Solitalea longa]|uniref:Dolichol-phosphate mannosyltransferase n=1 Tax=Solitalea longa TaxID=2079460 RepID=A0A2S5A392_9SPHI|nr:glycosyltransferase family 2 protein [Solitalea longa]POY36772.1 dolichol-phosphate mannosyltransferase [Solitalea longa]